MSTPPFLTFFFPSSSSKHLLVLLPRPPESNQNLLSPFLAPPLPFPPLLQVTPLGFWLHIPLTQLLPRSSKSFKWENGFHFSHLTAKHPRPQLVVTNEPPLIPRMLSFWFPSHQPVVILLLLPTASFSASHVYPILPMLWVLSAGVTQDFILGSLLHTLFSPA